MRKFSSTEFSEKIRVGHLKLPQKKYEDISLVELFSVDKGGNKKLLVQRLIKPLQNFVWLWMVLTYDKISSKHSVIYLSVSLFVKNYLRKSIKTSL